MNEPSIRVVVLDESATERTAIARALQRASYRVEQSSDPGEALSDIAREPPNVIVVSLPNRKGTDLLRLLRNADASGHAYVVAILDRTFSGRDLPGILADAQDFMHRPVDEDELLARVGAPGRLRRWLNGSGRSAPAETPKPAVASPSPITDLRRLRAWKNMGQLVVDDLAQVVGQNIQPMEGWPSAFGRGLRGATVGMSLPGESAELRIWIVADAVALRWLAGAVFADPETPEAKLQDALRELTNTAAGAVKRAALPDNVVFTTGIPVNATAVPARGEDTRCWVISPGSASEVSIALLAEVRARENVRLPVSDLREGMVLVHDLRNDAGALLAPAGTRLTTSSVERFAAALGPRFLVEVACAA
ncbi:MAG TPA: response regulator [Polyangiaceae bacterium]|nr:response regulator [Polyangiaceae bacterium]